ncbi:MAG: phosphotyrosine protein phosphatase [Clostridiales bacterium]|nr:phosphotyrosine protein phosphatase [Clostridiales bacterium]
MAYSRIIFVGQTGACREAMAAEIMREFMPEKPLEILARGLVVLFPEPMNRKAEAVLIGNGISIQGFAATQLQNSDITPDTLILVMESGQRARVLEKYPNAKESSVWLLNEYVGDELEVIDPYGGTLTAYGLCYETLRAIIKKIIKKLNEAYLEEEGLA